MRVEMMVALKAVKMAVLKADLTVDLKVA